MTEELVTYVVKNPGGYNINGKHYVGEVTDTKEKIDGLREQEASWLAMTNPQPVPQPSPAKLYQPASQQDERHDAEPYLEALRRLIDLLKVKLGKSQSQLAEFATLENEVERLRTELEKVSKRAENRARIIKEANILFNDETGYWTSDLKEYSARAEQDAYQRGIEEGRKQPVRPPREPKQKQAATTSETPES